MIWWNKINNKKSDRIKEITFYTTELKSSIIEKTFNLLQKDPQQSIIYNINVFFFLIFVCICLSSG